MLSILLKYIEKILLFSLWFSKYYLLLLLHFSQRPCFLPLQSVLSQAWTVPSMVSVQAEALDLAYPRRRLPSGMLVCVDQGTVVEALSHIWLFTTAWTHPPGCYVHGISQAGILEWVAISFSREPSQWAETLADYFLLVVKKFFLATWHVGS